MNTVDARLDALERENRLEEAARLAEKAGRWSRARDLWERACSYANASHAALEAGEPDVAVRLAARSGAAEPIARSLDSMSRLPERASRTAAWLAAENYSGVAASLYQRIGDFRAAAPLFERCGRLLEASRAHELAGDADDAIRCLTEQLRRTPDDDAARIELGRIRLERGELVEAARALQPVLPSRPERQAALQLLARTFRALELPGVVALYERELEARGDARPTAMPEAKIRTGEVTVLFGRYALETEVAKTPSARVLRAHDRITGRQVAIKLLLAARLRDTGRDAWIRIEREALALSRIVHPAIVPLVEYVREAPAIVTEWMPGGSLADRLAKEAFTADHAAEIVDAVLQALGEAHRRGILHRDVKPANVLFDGAGGARLGDFGSAHVNDLAITVTEGLLGSLAYMAPEQRAGHAATVASDVYGAGAVFWHLLTGAPPRAGAPLSADLTTEHETVARRLIGPAAARPGDAESARRLLRSVTWPAARLARPTPEIGETVALPSRLVPVDGPRHHDRWLERDVVILPASPSLLARARAFARAGHPALAAILCHTPEAGTVWVEHADAARSRIDARGLAELTDALSALHRAGGAHGSVDSEHLAESHGRFMLTFPHTVSDADPHADRRTLDALATTQPAAPSSVT